MNLKSKYKITKPLTVFVFLTSITLFCINFQSCEKIGTEDEPDYSLNIPEEYNEVGKLHNQGLDYVFNAIRAKHIENMKAADSNLKSAQTLDYQTIITDATLQFCKENKSLKENFDVCQAIVVKSNSNLKSAKIEGNALDGFNTKQKELLNEIFFAIKGKFSKENLDKLKMDLDKINRKTQTELNETEAAPIYCATSTAYATYQYWHNNYKKWYFALHFPEILKEYNDAQLNNLSLKNGTLRLKSTSGWWDDIWNTVEDWADETSDAVSDWWDENGSDIVEADAAGAATNVLYAIDSGVGEISLVFGPEGWVLTVTGAAVSGAIYSSAVGAIWPF